MALVQRHEKCVVVKPVVGFGAEFGEFLVGVAAGIGEKTFCGHAQACHAIELYCPVIDLIVFDRWVRSDIGIGQPA